MSLKQKYTWLDFLKEFPEHKAKKTKRASAEGKKAFDAAYKSFIKKYLSGRIEKLSRDIEKSTKMREVRVEELKKARKAKKSMRAKFAQKKVGRSDHAIANLKKQVEKTKIAQKSF